MKWLLPLTFPALALLIGLGLHTVATILLVIYAVEMLWRIIARLPPTQPLVEVYQGKTPEARVES